MRRGYRVQQSFIMGWKVREENKLNYALLKETSQMLKIYLWSFIVLTPKDN